MPSYSPSGGVGSTVEVSEIESLANGTIIIGDGSGAPTSLAAFTASNGTLKHESGGVEADISAIAKGGIVAGTGTGTMGILAAGTNGHFLTYQSGQTTGLIGVAGATASDINTGTNTTLPLTADALAGSNIGAKVVSGEVVAFATALTTGDGKVYFRIAAELNGMNLVGAAASVGTTSSSGTPTIQIARGRQASASSAHSFVDMLSTRITIDQGEYDSKDAAAAMVINTSNDDVATGDLIRVDVDVAGTSTTGLYVTLSFQLP